ncbi:hypothetical protein TNIN_253281 [Trichonephila inaurata madagascariensis]|uniref:Uncharacterized protein n=1 Tax=Trichonephila inaurata madagascariensis TaxID=2747483 RepID=A0A8X6XQZ6_9ARAC|nr:hypothetical protein TNIN_253281 [Trichonephila inaurata madagascariensis]
MTGRFEAVPAPSNNQGKRSWGILNLPTNTRLSFLSRSDVGPTKNTQDKSPFPNQAVLNEAYNTPLEKREGTSTCHLFQCPRSQTISVFPNVPSEGWMGRD